MAPYTITVPTDTDIWRKPAHNAFNAPSRIASAHSNKPMKSFQSARVTFSFPEGLIQQFDQGGLLLHITHPSLPCHSLDLNASQSSDAHQHCKWIKTGIEYFNNIPHLSTVCCDRYSDWSVVPVPLQDGARLPPSFTIEVERDNETTMWVYAVGESGERKPLREIAWVFAVQEDEEWVVSIGGMGAAPAKGKREGGGELEVEIKELDVKWR